MKCFTKRERILVFIVAPATILAVAGYYLFLYEGPAEQSHHHHHGHSHHDHDHSDRKHD